MMQKAILQAQLSVRDVCQSIQSKVESDMKCASQVSGTQSSEKKVSMILNTGLKKKADLNVHLGA